MTRTLDPWRFTRAARQANAQIISSTPESTMTDADRAKRQATRRRRQTAKQDWQQTATASPVYVARKLAACIRLARQCSRDSWQCSAHRAEFLRIKREAMTDARAWRGLQ